VDLIVGDSLSGWWFIQSEITNQPFGTIAVLSLRIEGDLPDYVPEDITRKLFGQNEINP